MSLRLENTHSALKKKGLDCLIVSSPANISYLSGHRSRDSYLILSRKENTYLTDGRYLEEAKKYIRGFKIKRADGDLIKTVIGICLRLKYRRVGFEGHSLSFASYTKLRQGFSGSIDLIPVFDLIEGLRQVKEAKELKYIRKATEITAMALKFIRGFLKPGVKEIEVAAEIERFIRYNGAFSSAFEIIVASGPNSSFPHHLTSQRRLKDNEPVLIDVGADYFGYKSDLTRVYFLGKISPLAAKIYGLVRWAQGMAINKIKPAQKIGEVDKAARQYISRSGYGGFFNHSLGHGIGLEAHEGPSISPKQEARLKKGMVFTVEPAVYLPGKFGIRIEDMVLVTAGGREVISGAVDK